MKLANLKILCIAIATPGLVACSEGVEQSANDSSDPSKIEQPTNPFDVNTFNLNKLVCDPFQDERPSAGFEAGLSAELYYLSGDQPRDYTAAEYIENGKKSNQDLFFTDVNVPTRLFNSGFPTETGDLIRTDEDDVLVEYFALRFKSELVLGPDQVEGLYELALLSDDGSVLKIEQNDQLRVVVDNDGNHPTRFGCGEVIEMKRGESHKIEISYYQGPRFHISVIPMWRRVSSLDETGDPLCGVQGNRKYFDFDDNSKPMQAYVDLIDRGWSPIAASNYRLPSENAFNPCAGVNEPVISDMYVIDILDGGVRVTWKTDIPATSQVMYSSSERGVVTTTTSDNILRVQHAVDIPDPGPGESYLIRAISVSATLGKTISSGKILRGQ